jgi:hypothetical protein
MSLSPNQFLLNPDGTEGDENHTIYQPIIFDISNHNISDGSKKLSEARVFYGCVMRGLEYQSNRPSTPSVSYELEGDHLAHVIELGRSTVDGNLVFDYSKLTDNEQYGNLIDQVLLAFLMNWKEII